MVGFEILFCVKFKGSNHRDLKTCSITCIKTMVKTMNMWQSLVSGLLGLKFNVKQSTFGA